MQSTETTIELRLWTVEEYHRMAEAGIFDEDERVELLEGKIIYKNACKIFLRFNSHCA